jgi:hypothetical protein
VTPALADRLERRLAPPLANCPRCGHEVPARADALRYRGEFHHIPCALARHEQEQLERLRRRAAVEAFRALTALT